MSQGTGGEASLSLRSNAVRLPYHIRDPIDADEGRYANEFPRPQHNLHSISRRPVGISTSGLANLSPNRHSSFNSGLADSNSNQRPSSFSPDSANKHQTSLDTSP